MNRFASFALAAAAAFAVPVAAHAQRLPSLDLEQAGAANAFSAFSAARQLSAGHGIASTATVIGTLAGRSASTLTMTMLDGSRGTFNLPTGAFAQTAPKIGQRYAIGIDPLGNVTRIALADQSVRGTVESISSGTLTVQLSTGRAVKITLAPEQASLLHLSVGSVVTLATHDGGETSHIFKN